MRVQEEKNSKQKSLQQLELLSFDQLVSCTPIDNYQNKNIEIVQRLHCIWWRPFVVAIIMQKQLMLRFFRSVATLTPKC